MVNLTKFIKNHIPLCTCTIGLAIIGYLGFHAIRWIIKKSEKAEKIDRIAQKNLSSPLNNPKSLINRVKLKLSPGKISQGQGEYIIFHNLPNGERKKLSKETFEQVYKTLNEYAPAAIMNRNSDSAAEECENRFEIIRDKVKKIDPTLEVVFVPRTLYELIFIRKCIKEDLKHNEICPLLDPCQHKKNWDSFDTDQKYNEFSKNKAALIEKRNCWHLCYFEDAGDNDHTEVKKIAYRLNKAVIKTLSPSAEGFTFQELSQYAEKEIEFLKEQYKTACEEMGQISNCITPGPTTNFRTESNKRSIKPMGIRNESDAQIIRDAIALDCSEIAKRSLFLYRGANYQKDSPFSETNNNVPYSLSYGTSLFAGCLYDGGATAFYYMRKEQNAYAIPVPYDQINKSPFYIPTTHTIAQLFGNGEFFHSRTKAWKNFDVKNIDGINIGLTSGNNRDHLKSKLDQGEFIAQFQEYKNKAMHLKYPKFALLRKLMSLIS